MGDVIDEPALPRKLRRPLAAIWVSLGLHAAVIALVQVAPPGTAGIAGPVIEARLVSAPVSEPESETELAPSDIPDALPVASVEPAEPAPPVHTPTPVESPVQATAPVTITSATDFNFYSARELDVQPRALRAIEPAYPADADRSKLSGSVRLQLKLEADGRVIDVDVVRSSPPGVFDEAAVKAFKQAQFAPAIKAGRPVRALILIEVNFDWAGQPH